jgi:recombination protein RecT
MPENKLALRNESDLKKFLATNYQKQIQNYFGNEQKALKFLSAVVADVQRNPALLKCDPRSLVNSYMIMAGCEFMPSGVSGEAYVLPYGGVAQFQMGYQGLVTLFYKAGVTKIASGIVYKNDKIEITNDEIKHTVDPTMSKKERGEAVGAYVIVTFKGEKNGKYMNGKDILEHAKKFSKSYSPDGKYSPWNPANDPELTMWMKTVLKQHSKLLPKNETINKAIAADNQDSRLSDRIEAAKRSSDGLKMGNLLENGKNNETESEGSQEAPENHEEPAVEVE